MEILSCRSKAYESPCPLLKHYPTQIPGVGGDHRDRDSCLRAALVHNWSTCALLLPRDEIRINKLSMPLRHQRNGAKIDGADQARYSVSAYSHRLTSRV